MAIFIAGIKIVAGLLAALIGTGATYQFIATKLDEKRYPAPGKMVDIGGYKLHMLEMGGGGPTVVLDTGTGCNTLDWSLVQPEIAKFTRVISYDRAGYAWSDESTLARTAQNIVEELHVLLHNANVPKPYILVGHSAGGGHVRLYAEKYPDEVAGIILVDASHEDQIEKLPKVNLPSNLILLGTRLGIWRLISKLPQLRDTIKQYPADIQRVYFSQKTTTKFVKTFLDENARFEESCQQLKAARCSIGSKPLTVITRGKNMTKEESAGLLTEEQVVAGNIAWDELQKDLVTKSTSSKQIIAEKSGHMINCEQPEVIVSAVKEMVDEIRK